MPAPIVYALAIVGTVGAVLAFKEFVYEPHISPAVDRWKLELAARRRRHGRVPSTSEAELDVPMQEQTRRGSMRSRHRDSGRHSDDDDGDDAPGANSHSNRFMKDGLLLRRINAELDAQQGHRQPHQRNQPSSSSFSTSSGVDTESDDLVAREVDEWRREIASSTAHDLRQRNNVSGHHALDESVHPIPYVPLSPVVRPHVLFDSTDASPATAGTASKLPSLPGSPALRNATGADNVGIALPPTPISSWNGSQANVLSSGIRGSESAGQPEGQAQTPFINSFPTSSPLPGIGAAISPAQPHEDVSSTHTQARPQRPPYPQHVPSLSQSYPQDLDYEHGLELLSPPSSRSDSPFSMAEVSPNPTPSGLTRLSTSQSSSAFSSAVSSPLPLGMGLGNESYDTLSPVTQHRQLASSSSTLSDASPFRDPIGPSSPPVTTHHRVPVSMQDSVRSSSRSSAYLSFSSDNEDDDVPLALSHSRTASQTQQGGAVGTASSNPTSPPQPLLFSLGPQPTSTAPLVRQQTQRPGQQGVLHTPAQSDSELSDLDFMSDYAPSESDGEVVYAHGHGSGSEHGRPLGASVGANANQHAYESDSDAGWSVAGGSDVGPDSPRMEGPGGVGLTRGGTLRGAPQARNGDASRFGWRR